MTIHHENEIITALRNANKQLNRKDVFHLVFSATLGAARHNKLLKAWKRAIENGQIIRTPGKRYVAA